jgi:hypothetical protein
MYYINLFEKEKSAIVGKTYKIGCIINMLHFCAPGRGKHIEVIR